MHMHMFSQLIKIYLVVQELWALSLTEHGRTNVLHASAFAMLNCISKQTCSKCTMRFKSYEELKKKAALDNVGLNLYAQFDQK